MYGELHPDVIGFLERRHLNAAMQTEIPPKCAVTTGLLIALHHTAHGKNDVLDRVIEMDDHPWVSVPVDLSKEEQEAMRNRCRVSLRNRIRFILGKFVGPNAKDRSKLAKAGGSELADIRRCLNCLLRDTYVPMPGKRVESRKKSATQTKRGRAPGRVSTSESIGDVAPPTRWMADEE
jgi:hypothetical protein